MKVLKKLKDVLKVLKKLKLLKELKDLKNLKKFKFLEKGFVGHVWNNNDFSDYSVILYIARIIYICCICYFFLCVAHISVSPLQHSQLSQKWLEIVPYNSFWSCFRIPMLVKFWIDRISKRENSCKTTYRLVVLQEFSLFEIRSIRNLTSIGILQQLQKLLYGTKSFSSMTAGQSTPYYNLQSTNLNVSNFYWHISGARLQYNCEWINLSSSWCKVVNTGFPIYYTQ